MRPTKKNYTAPIHIMRSYILRKQNFFLVIFLLCILLSACNPKLKFEKSQDEFSTTYKNEHIEVQIANNVENPEEEIKNLSYASTSLVKYLLDNGKKEQLFKEEMPIDDIRPWAEQNNIDLTYLEKLYNHINEIKVSNPSAFEKLYLETRRETGGFSIRVTSAEEEYDTAKELEQVPYSS